MESVSIKAQVLGEPIPRETIGEIVKSIADHFHPQKIVLFGSYASGHPTADSDLDLLIIMDTPVPRHKRATPIHLLFRPAPCAMDILVYTPEEIRYWKGTVNHVVTEALASGEVMYERQEP